jgi:hypothetical protein
MSDLSANPKKGELPTLKEWRRQLGEDTPEGVLPGG